jgi:hypothetical protein
MKRNFLGDSYDAVKRMWRELLSVWAPLYAEPRFLPQELRQDFSKLTGIPMLTNVLPDYYSILNDPDTGIRLPRERNQAEGCAHVTIDTIIDQLEIKGVRCVVTFDQSDYRHSGQSREQQRCAKMRCLVDKGLSCFYYVSHAPFLFAVPDAETLKELEQVLTNAGVPEKRFEKPH